MKELLASDKVLMLVDKSPGNGEERCSDRTIGIIGSNWLLEGVEGEDMVAE